MKKLLLLISLIATLTACGGTQETTENKETTTVKEVKEETKEDNKMIGGEEKGDGTFYIENPSGTSEDGNILWVQEDKDIQLMQIGYYAENMDGSVPTEVYLDGEKLDSLQVSHEQGSLTLEKKHLTPGIHNVEVIQGDTFYRLMQYEVK